MIAVSTHWNFSRHGKLAAAVREIRDLGFEAVELRAEGAVPDCEEGGRLCREFRLRCRSIRAPLTAGGWTDGDPSRGLASPDEGLRNRAVRAVLSTLPAAAAAGTEVVVLRLGAVDLSGASEEHLRWLEAVARGDDPPETEIRDALASRRARRDAHLDAAARSLFELTRAEPGVTFAFPGGEGLHGIPDLEEVELLLSDAAGRRVAYWHDAGHAEILGRLGVADPLAWLDRYGARTAGVSLHDSAGALVHLPPGTGEVDWPALAGYVGSGMTRVLEIAPRFSAAELLVGADHLRSLGLG